MNIVREQRGENNSLIRVTVGEADYGQEVEKSLREYKRKANIPGFRHPEQRVVFFALFSYDLHNEWLLYCCYPIFRSEIGLQR